MGAALIPQTLGTIALLGMLGGTVLAVIAAAEGNSFIANRLTQKAPHWLTWPFAGLWSNRTYDHRDLEVGLLVLLIAMFAFYGVAVVLAARVRPAIVWTLIGATYVVLFLSPPLLLTDVFNYSGYARMGVVHHLNPYTHLPIDASHDPIFYLSNWHHLRSPYGPLFTLGTYALVPLGIAGSYWAYKAAVMIASIACLVVVFLIARRLGRRALPAVVLVGMNPMVLLYGTGGQHNDAFVLLFTLGSIYFAITQRESLGAAAMVGATALKASAGVLVPIAALGSERRGRAIAGTIVGAVVFGGLWLAGFGPHLPGIGTQSKLVSVWSIPNMVGIALGRGGSTPMIRTGMEVLLIGATIFCGAWAWRSRKIIEPLGWLTLASLVTIGWDMPWYVLWLLPFIAFVRQRAFRVIAVLVTVWIMVSYLPHFGNAAGKLGFHPSHTRTWHGNVVYTSRYLH